MVGLRNVFAVTKNSLRGSIYLGASREASVLSFPCHTLFWWGLSNVPAVKLSGVTMISKFKCVPTRRKRTPESRHKSIAAVK